MSSASLSSALWGLALTWAALGACGDPSTATPADAQSPSDAPLFDAGGADGGAETVDIFGETADPPSDRDQDLIPDAVDNCPDLFNPQQEDTDLDGIGDPCDPIGGDRDQDQVPDVADPWPDDPERPGSALPNTVYAHTSTRLYRLAVKTQAVHEVGPFVWPAGASSHEMTDIAIDRYGVLYAISFDDVFVCHPVTVQCWRLAALPTSFNGLTLIPRSVLGTAEDTLVGIAQDGGWWRLSLVAGAIQSTYLGTHGGTYTSSGDAFSIEGVGTFASVNKGGGTLDYLVRLDPATGAVLSEVAPFTGYGSVWGLAGWAEQVFAFDATGDILVINLTTGQRERVISGGQAWWGAGVRTRLDP